MKSLIVRSKSIIPALDVDTLDETTEIVEETCDIEGIGAYKIGFSLVLRFGLTIVKRIRNFTDKPIIYDHQKGATDIPEMGSKFAKVCKSEGVDAVILFPLTGPVVEEAWIKSCQDVDLRVIVGGRMTHKGFLESEGGFICNDASQKIYRMAYEFGVRDFVVPGNKPDFVQLIREAYPDVVLYAPGFIAQNGDVSETGKAAVDNWHAIVGRGIYEAAEKEKIARELSKNL